MTLLKILFLIYILIRTNKEYFLLFKFSLYNDKIMILILILVNFIEGIIIKEVTDKN